MSQSAIRYKNRAAYIKDEDLREFLKLLSFFSENAPNNLDWIVDAIASWMDDHEGLPPGLRDIELDEVLNSLDRVVDFKHYLDALLKQPIGEGPYDKARAAHVVERVLNELNSGL